MSIEEILLLFGGLVILIFILRFVWKMTASFFKLGLVIVVVIVGLYAYKPTIYNSIIGEDSVAKIEASVSNTIKSGIKKIKTYFQS